MIEPCSMKGGSDSPITSPAGRSRWAHYLTQRRTSPAEGRTWLREAETKDHLGSCPRLHCRRRDHTPCEFRVLVSPWFGSEALGQNRNITTPSIVGVAKAGDAVGNDTPARLSTENNGKKILFPLSLRLSSIMRDRCPAR